MTLSISGQAVSRNHATTALTALLTASQTIFARSFQPSKDIFSQPITLSTIGQAVSRNHATTASIAPRIASQAGLIPFS